MFNVFRRSDIFINDDVDWIFLRFLPISKELKKKILKKNNDNSDQIIDKKIVYGNGK